MPEDLWWACLAPAPLAAMRYPAADFDWGRAAAAGFGRVVCLTSNEPSYDPSPLRCTAVRLQDLIGGGPPDDPDREMTSVREAVEAVTSSLADGQGALVHCGGGRGRSGTVVGAALVTAGEHADDVAVWLDRVHRVRGRPGWPESRWQREVLNEFAERP